MEPSRFISCNRRDKLVIANLNLDRTKFRRDFALQKIAADNVTTLDHDDLTLGNVGSSKKPFAVNWTLSHLGFGRAPGEGNFVHKGWLLLSSKSKRNENRSAIRNSRCGCKEIWKSGIQEKRMIFGLFLPLPGLQIRLSAAVEPGTALKAPSPLSLCRRSPKNRAVEIGRLVSLRSKRNVRDRP
jgi:hypothetical protein